MTTTGGSSPPPSLTDSNHFDYQLFTDGSCDSKDRIAGYAAVAYNPASNVMIYRGGATTGSSVNRSEMLALLAGLQVIGEFSGVLDAGHRKQLTECSAMRPVVLWYTDRQNVARSITPPPDTRPYKRDVDADLWAQIAWWELWFKIKAMNVPRNTVGAQTECDRVAGELRKALKAKVNEWQGDPKSPTILQ
jgi:ribonuclease HI